MRALLDVNVLIALLDADHATHGRATAWLAEHARQGWASCPVTQNGCMRVIPGTHIEDSPYTVSLRQLFFDIEAAPQKVGVALDEIPAHTISVDPGDIVVGNFRTIHGSFQGGPRRRLITMDFHRGKPAA